MVTCVMEPENGDLPGARPAVFETITQGDGGDLSEEGQLLLNGKVKCMGYVHVSQYFFFNQAALACFLLNETDIHCMKDGGRVGKVR